MERPIITYHVLDSSDTYVKQNSVYAGTYTGDDILRVKLRIWNNYKGTEAVQDLENFNLMLHFLTEEDNALLPYIELSITDKTTLLPIIENKALIGTFPDPVKLSGGANTGSEEYIKNYINITVAFKAGADAYLKDYDLKSLVLEIVEI